jgi:ribosome-associated protein
MKKNLHDTVITALEELKAQDIVSIDVQDITDVMDTMVVASGNSSRQVRSLANNVIVEAKAAGYSVFGVEGENTGEWVLVDFGDVIIHIMLPATRIFYDLEKLWSMRPDDTHSHSEPALLEQKNSEEIGD